MSAYHSEEIEPILSSLGTSLKGIKKEEVLERRKKYGENKLQEKKHKSIWILIGEQFKEPMTIILLIAAAFGFVSAGLNLEHDDLIPGVSIEGIVIVIILFINWTITIIQEIKTTNALDALNKMSAPTCRVIRDGVQDQIPASELVVGDIVYLDDGCIIPADIRLIDASSLRINESALTGESVPVEKNSDIVVSEKTVIAEQVNMAFASTIVTNGKSYGVVVNVGKNSEVGKIAELLNENDHEEIPLQKKLNAVCKKLTIVGAIVCLIVVVTSLLYDVNGWTKTILLGISLAVSIIPEGLPTTATIVLAIGVQKMAKQNVLVKNLASVETLGSVDVICSDKTGTLTQNKMIIKEVYAGLSRIEPSVYNQYNELLMGGVYCNNAFLEDDGNLLGDPTEGAFLLLAKDTFPNWKQLKNKYPKIEELPFDSVRKRMTTFHDFDHQIVAFTKGSVESLLDVCTKIKVDGQIRPITSSDRDLILQEVNELANKAFRTLGICTKNISGDLFKDEEKDLTWLGMVAMYDPPREEVKKIIEICHTAHINVIMITGDHPLTARAIGTYLNICNANDEVLTGHDLELLTFHELKEKVKTVKIFARVSPSDKINIVKALKANGKVVAMTGDGVNDSPSLKLADVGVAMGITGTDVAKDAANIILLDDNFSTIAVAIKEGRRIFSNIQKVIAFLVAGNIAEILIILVATLFTNQFHPLPLTAILILFVNLLTDTIPGIALGLDRASPNIMTYRPVGNKQFFNRRTIFNMLYYGALLALIVLGIYLIGKYSLHIEDPKVLVALSFATVSITEMGLILCFKSSTISIFSPRLKYNPWIFYSSVISIGLTILLIVTPGLNDVFDLAPLRWDYWIYAILFSLIPLLFAESLKLYTYIKKRRKVNTKPA